ncbi:hypothetical protein LCGC14_0862540 [marine sediment metagenome]|uniref:AP2/ERF domain-containing protein n=1 Tax=marine sediment metagenome TaxID=412755 RepID=A0A0F9P6Y4_9ZZZZ
MKITIFNGVDCWNWEFKERKDDNQQLGIYGKGFKTEKEATLDAERYFKEMGITEYIIEVEK